jgi:hypothetical protein
MAAAAILLASPALQAQERPGLARPPVRINRMERREAHFIRQGVRSGELTRPETRRLVNEQQRIRRHEAIAKSDGTLTPNERQHLRGELRRAGRHIYRNTHDRQQR